MACGLVGFATVVFGQAFPVAQEDGRHCRDLVDFRGPPRGWAGAHSPRQAEPLVASVDAGPRITEPLPH